MSDEPETSLPKGSNAPHSLDEPSPEEVTLRLASLIDRHRNTCLWYLRLDYYPETLEARRRVLDAIEANGDLEAFRQARSLRVWLSHPSNSASSR